MSKLTGTNLCSKIHFDLQMLKKNKSVLLLFYNILRRETVISSQLCSNTQAGNISARLFRDGKIFTKPFFHGTCPGDVCAQPVDYFFSHKLSGCRFHDWGIRHCRFNSALLYQGLFHVSWESVISAVFNWCTRIFLWIFKH